jgi:biotin-dependent carboxylase-like uncharacterized protein
MNAVETFEVVDAGVGATIQDAGRFGWQRFGVPPSGAMDEHAFTWANRLLDNPSGAPCIEILMGGFRARALRDCRIAFAGADLGVRLNDKALALWRTVELHRDDVIAFPGGHAGLWCYLAVEGGLDAPEFFGSASTYARGGLGRPLQRGDVVSAKSTTVSRPGAIAKRFAAADEIPDYTAPLVARVVPGPQAELFSEKDTAKFFQAEYAITAQIDRAGYRLEGPAVKAAMHDIFSEGIAYGAIQIPENGQPIVMMKDRPTVGGYPKIGTLLPEDTARLAQCRPSQTVRFERIDL